MGRTPLQVAVYHSNYEAVKVLLEAGADKDVCVGEGWFYENSREDAITHLRSVYASTTPRHASGPAPTRREPMESLSSEKCN